MANPVLRAVKGSKLTIPEADANTRSVSTLDVTASRAITAADDGYVLRCSNGITLTIPAGLSPMPRFAVEFKTNGSTVNVASSGGTLMNGATTTQTRSTTYNPSGFPVTPYDTADSYGVGGA